MCLILLRQPLLSCGGVLLRRPAIPTRRRGERGECWSGGCLWHESLHSAFPRIPRVGASPRRTAQIRQREAAPPLAGAGTESADKPEKLDGGDDLLALLITTSPNLKMNGKLAARLEETAFNLPPIHFLIPQAITGVSLPLALWPGFLHRIGLRHGRIQPHEKPALPRTAAAKQIGLLLMEFGHILNFSPHQGPPPEAQCALDAGHAEFRPARWFCAAQEHRRDDSEGGGELVHKIIAGGKRRGRAYGGLPC